MADKYAPQKRYAAKNRRTYTFAFFASTEGELIDKLEKVPNKAGYIKALIRKDIENEKRNK